MPIKVKLMREDDSVLEEKIVPLCYPYQVKGVVSSVTKMETRSLDDKYEEVTPPQIMNLRVLTRDGIAEILKLNGRNAEIFLANTNHYLEGQRFVIELESLAVRALSEQS